MNHDNFHDDFLNTSIGVISSSKQKTPDWVSDKNSSKKAYHALIELYETKRAFISRQNKKSDFKGKYTYHISKSEVAQRIGVAMQPLFYSVKYAVPLKNLLANKNLDLLSLKEKLIAKSYTGIKAKTKQQLIKNVQISNTKYNSLATQSAEKMLELALEKMPLDIRQKLGLL